METLKKIKLVSAKQNEEHFCCATPETDVHRFESGWFCTLALLPQFEKKSQGLNASHFLAFYSQFYNIFCANNYLLIEFFSSASFQMSNRVSKCKSVLVGIMAKHSFSSHTVQSMNLTLTFCFNKKLLNFCVFQNSFN